MLYLVSGPHSKKHPGPRSSLGLELSRNWRSLIPNGFQVGIGIHSGRVIVGEMQLGKMIKTSVMGLAVNIASRIQDSTKTLNNSFVVSEEVLAHSTLEANGSEKMINLKGISSPIRVHLLGKPYG
jgi:adenylate cyclase